MIAVSLNLRLMLLMSAVVFSLILIVYTWLRGKKSATLNSYLYFQTILIIWSFCQILRVFSTNLSTEWLEVRIEYFAICYIGLCWLFFCLRYTESKFVNSRLNIVLLFVLPTICYISVLTNQYHHLFFSKYDLRFNKPAIIFWIHTIESYSYCMLGTILLIGYSFKQFGYIRKQIILLVLGALIPFLFNLALISNIINPGFDVTPLSFTISLLLYAVAIFKYKLLNTEAIALRKIVDNMKESILVVDNFNRIKDFNNAFGNAFFEYGIFQIGDEINTVVKKLGENIGNSDESLWLIEAIADIKIIRISGELNLVKPNKRCFTVNIQPIPSNKEIIGRVISFNDITDYKNLWDELHAKNIELSTKNEQLEKYAKTIEELAVANERNRFARDVHDTLGQTMTLLITLLQIIKNECRSNLNKAETRLDEALKIASDGLTEVRRSLIGLAPENIDSLKNVLQSLAENFRTSGMKIDLTIDESMKEHDLIFAGVIYRICQEALTNSLRHGKADHVVITLMFGDKYLYLGINDNGIGCKNLIKGFGLCGMEQRVMNLGGVISYNHHNSGFGILVEIPLLV